MDKQGVIQFILTIAAKQSAIYALPAWSIEEESFSFLKKSPTYLGEESYRITMRLLD